MHISLVGSPRDFARIYWEFQDFLGKQLWDSRRRLPELECLQSRNARCVVRWIRTPNKESMVPVPRHAH